MAQAPLQLGDDVQVVESRRDVRIVLSLPARYTLTNRRDPDGQRREYAGRVINMSCRSMALAGPAIGDKGERVIAHIDEFGKLEGPIIRLLDGAFVMEIVAPQSERDKLAGKIAWYEKRKNHDIEDNRGHDRIIPRDPHSTLVFADGTTMDCLVINLSVAGAAGGCRRRPGARHGGRGRPGRGPRGAPVPRGLRGRLRAAPGSGNRRAPDRQVLTASLSWSHPRVLI